MNDDEKKPVVPEGEAVTSNDVEAQDDIKIEVEQDAPSSDGDSDVSSDKSSTSKDSEKHDISALDSHDEDEVTEIDRELERVEGIESAEIRSEQPQDHDVKKDVEKNVAAIAPDEEVRATKPVDLDPVTPNAAKEHALMTAMRNQDNGQGSKKGKLGIVAAVLGIVMVVAFGIAGYLYMQNTDISDQKASIESELEATKSQNVQLKLQEAKIKETAQKEAEETASQSASAYRTIPELGVRFKETDTTKNLIYGYTVTGTETSVDSVAFSTVVLARLTQRNGASATYPCGLTGNAPTITRYKQDIAVGTSMASKLGKKIGDAYFVYTAATGQCATTNTTDIAARDTGVKAVYENLEALPEASSAITKK